MFRLIEINRTNAILLNGADLFVKATGRYMSWNNDDIDGKEISNGNLSKTNDIIMGIW